MKNSFLFKVSFVLMFASVAEVQYAHGSPNVGLAPGDSDCGSVVREYSICVEEEEAKSVQDGPLKDTKRESIRQACEKDTPGYLSCVPPKPKKRK